MISLSWLQTLATITVQTVLTAVMAARDFSGYRRILFILINDGANPVDFAIETGEAANATDAEFVTTITVPAAVGAQGTQRVFTVEDNMRSFYRVSATATGGASACRYGVRAERRLVAVRESALR